MKKIITLLIAATMIIGFAGIAMAADECATCVAPGTINRACPTEQNLCISTPFDYEDVENYFYVDGYGPTDNYCEELYKQDRRVLFPACDCDNFVEGDTIDIRLEILVNGLAGDNGAYWAEDVSSIDIGTYQTQTQACDDEHDYNGTFDGPFDMLYYNEDGNLVSDASPETTSGAYCWTSSTSNREARAVVIQPNADIINGDPGDCPTEHGYVITSDDDIENRAIWAINIPLIRFDLNKVQAGDVISVSICMAKAVEVDGCDYDAVDLGGICGDTGCCCEFELGTLGCCDDDSNYGLIYPYATPMNSLDWWYGFVITNLDSMDGEADITVYETNADGSVDTATITVSVAANSLYVTNNQSLMAEFGGDIGDGRAYFEVNTDFDASGFLFIGNDMKAEAMGYLPESYYSKYEK